MKKHLIDSTLFNAIDQSWKAHFLGWLYADGCMQKDGYRVTLALQEKDKCVLDYFAGRLYGKTEGVVQYRKPTNPVCQKTGKQYHGNPQYILRVNNKVICSSLWAKGLIPAKSLILAFPSSETIPSHFLWHFVRGYFEGDGSIRKIRNNHSSDVTIMGVKTFLEPLQERLKREGIPSSIIPVSSIFGLCIHGVDNLIRFYNLIYRDAEFVLERKKARFDEVIRGRDVATPYNKTSRYRGITYKAAIKRYVARATINKQRFNIGCFKTENEAHVARNRFLEMHGNHVTPSI